MSLTMEEISLQLNDFGVGYGSRTLLRDVEADFPRGTLTALLGRNGTGKSTLLRALVGLQPHRGSVIVGGVDSRELNAIDMARSIAFVGTDRARPAAMRCRDIVALGRAPYTGWMGRLSTADQALVDQSLAALDMQHFAERQVHTLSDGEYQRIMIARALAQDTPVMILDEPTSFLDLPNRYDLCTLLAHLAHEQRKCVIFSTHELDIAVHLADRIALIDTPSLAVESTAEMCRSGRIQRLFDPDGRIPGELLAGPR